MGALKKPVELSYDELNALTLRLFRELEVAHESMETMYNRVSDRLKELKERAKDEKFYTPEDRKVAQKAAYELQGLFDRYNEFPDKTYKLRRFVEKMKNDFREGAAEQWVRLEKFLTLTNLDNIHRDVVTGDHISSAFSGWDNPDSLEDSLFNEERLYEALGKDDARTILAMFRRFFEIRTMRRRIEHDDDEYTPKIDPKEVMFRFAESELFQKMEHLLDWSRTHLKKTLVDKEAKGFDKHTEPQHKNLQRQLEELCERLKRVAPKRKETS